MVLVNRIFSFLICVAVAAGPVFAQATISSRQGIVAVFEDDFSGPLNDKHWVPELEAPANSSVRTEKGKLIIDASAGVTVWCKKPFAENIRIEYDWTVLVDSGKNDRLSDLNQFWMASDLRRTDLFTRKGKFEEYDSLQLYYVGFGGNSNTTTRFRKYKGNGQKPLLLEYTDQAHLLTANRPYHIKIEVINGKTSFSVDGNKLFEYLDPKPLKSGYFGFRSTGARHAIDNFKVYQLTE